MIKFKNMFLIAALLLPVAIITSCNKDDDADDDKDVNVNPVVESTSPQNDALNAERNIVITATFSEAMDAASINSTSFTLKQGATTIAGEVTYTGMVATFTPTSTLNAAEIFTATLTTAAKSSAGMFLENNYEWSFTSGGNASGIDAVNLGASANYLILAKAAINNSGTSALTGDLGLSPAATSYITGLALTDFTGYATSAQVTGQVFAADMADPTPITLTTAVENMITAYNDAAGRSSVDFLDLGTGNIGGKTLAPGIYKWTTTVTIPTDVVISGNDTDIWIFQIAGDLTMSTATNITLSGGAQAGNIFWQVAGQATVGTGAHFEGVILSMTSITFQTGATLNGRLLAQTAVVLDGNALTKP
ncbi:MAG: ice-binding family protein [Salinivirgaceae bacterium]